MEYPTGWKVMDDKGKEYSKKPLPRKRAVAQMRALYANDLEGAGLLGDILGKIKATAKRYFAPPPAPAPVPAQTDVGLPPTSVLQQMVKVAYDGGTVNGWTILKRTPTLTFFQRGETVVIAVRGTYDKRDIRADLAIPLDNLENTDRFKEDLATVQQFVQQNPNYRYYATGHSLGGAIIDKLLQLSLVKDAISFNPAIEPSDYQKGDRHRRIYLESDPLYKLMGKNAVGTEVRPSKFSLLRSIPGVGQILDTALSHSIDNFVGGNVEDNMIRMPKSDYYVEHKRIIDLLNKTSASLKSEADEQSAEVRKQRKGGSACLRYGGRSLRGFVVDCESDSDYEDEDIESIEGGAEPMEVPSAGVPFDMVHLVGPALPTFGKEPLNGGRVEPQAMNREQYIQMVVNSLMDQAINERLTGHRVIALIYRAARDDEDLAEDIIQRFRQMGVDLDALGERGFVGGRAVPPDENRERMEKHNEDQRERERQIERQRQIEELRRQLQQQERAFDEEMRRIREREPDEQRRREAVRALMMNRARANPNINRRINFEGQGKMTLPMLKAKAKEAGLKGFSKMKKGELMEALKGGAKQKTEDDEFEEMLKMAQYKMREGIFDKERPKGPSMSIRAPKEPKIAVGLDGTVAVSPKKATPKVEVKPSTQTLSLGLPAPVKKGRGLAQSKAKVAPAPKARARKMTARQMALAADTTVGPSEDPEAVLRGLMNSAIEMRGRVMKGDPTMEPNLGHSMEADAAKLEERYKKKFGREFVPPLKPVGMKRQGEGRGRLQRRSPKTLRLSAKDKGKC